MSDCFYIEDPGGSEGEGQTLLTHRGRDRTRHRAACWTRGRTSSPPLLLVYPRSQGSQQDSWSCEGSQQDCRSSEGSQQDSRSSQGSQQDCGLDHGAGLQEEDGDSDQSVEEWMVLDGAVREEDTSIQLNLSYWSSAEEDSGDEGPSEEEEEEEEEESAQSTWAVSEKDKRGARHFLPDRYFAAAGSRPCQLCSRTGHPTRSCSLYKKCPTCVLCGTQGHSQRACPGRPCVTCGLPAHGLRACEVPPVWNQHCQRCGMTGHLCDVCPDLWRQYHSTIRVEAPLRPLLSLQLKPKRSRAHCYNCSRRGHHGHECTQRRMVSGTFPSLPYVCHYDTMEDILQRLSRGQGKAKEAPNAASLLSSDPGSSLEKAGSCGEEEATVPARSRTRQEASSRAGRRKTWPEKRRERREVKRLRKEAQAIREGGLLPRHRHSDQVSASNPFGKAPGAHRPSTSPKRKRRDEAGGGKRRRRSNEAEKWRKKGGMKRVDLFPHRDGDSGCENLLSPKQRVRHRRR